MARTAARWAAVVALALCLGACGDDDDPGDATPTTTEPATSTSTTTTAPEPTDEEAVTQLVEEWWQVSREVAAQERPIDDIEAFISGEYLERYRTDIGQYFADGKRDELSDESTVTVESVEVNGDEGTVEMCTVDHDKVVDDDGGVLEEGVTVSRYRDEVAREGSEWRVVLRTALGDIEGATECPRD